MERQSLDLLAKASASPEGEKATAWTQPPEGEENSPQTVLKGSLLPQTVGSGLRAFARGRCQHGPASLLELTEVATESK